MHSLDHASPRRYAPRVDLARRKEQFSLAYAHAISAVTGFKLFRCDVDDESVDLTVGSTKAFGTSKRSPRLDVQLKCTETDDGEGATLAYALPLKNYEDLRVADVHVPQILVVLCVPRDASQWLTHKDDHSVLRRTAYWVSIRGADPTTNKTTQTVHLPRSQRFGAPALTEMMVRIGEGGMP